MGRSPLPWRMGGVVRVRGLSVGLQAGVGRWLKSPDTAADGWRFRVQANFVLPKTW